MFPKFCFRIFSSITILVLTCCLFQYNHTILQGDFYILMVGSTCAAFIVLFIFHEIYRFFAPSRYARYQQWLIDNDAYLGNKGIINYYLSRALSLNFFMEMLSFFSLIIFFLYFFTFLNEYHNSNSAMNFTAQVTDKTVSMIGYRAHPYNKFYLTKIRTPKGNIKINAKNVFRLLDNGDLVTVTMFKGNLGLYYATEMKLEKTGLRIFI